MRKEQEEAEKLKVLQGDQQQSPFFFPNAEAQAQPVVAETPEAVPPVTQAA